MTSRKYIRGSDPDGHAWTVLDGATGEKIEHVVWIDLEERRFCRCASPFRLGRKRQGISEHIARAKRIEADHSARVVRIFR